MRRLRSHTRLDTKIHSATCRIAYGLDPVDYDKGRDRLLDRHFHTCSTSIWVSLLICNFNPLRLFPQTLTTLDHHTIKFGMSSHASTSNGSAAAAPVRCGYHLPSGHQQGSAQNSFSNAHSSFCGYGSLSGHYGVSTFPFDEQMQWKLRQLVEQRPIPAHCA